MQESTPQLTSLGLCKTYLHNAREVINLVGHFEIAGRVTRVTGLVIEAVGIKLPMGSACIIPLQNGEEIREDSEEDSMIGLYIIGAAFGALLFFLCLDNGSWTW